MYKNIDILTGWYCFDAIGTRNSASDAEEIGICAKGSEFLNTLCGYDESIMEVYDNATGMRKGSDGVYSLNIHDWYSIPDTDYEIGGWCISNANVVYAEIWQNDKVVGYVEI